MKYSLYTFAAIFVVNFGFLNSPVLSKDKVTIVTTTTVDVRKLSKTIPLSASTEAFRETELSSKVAGIVKEVYVTEGQYLNKGDAILLLDDEIARLDIASARARLEETKIKHKDALRLKKEYQSLAAKKAISPTQLSSSIANVEITNAAIAREKTLLNREQAILNRHQLTSPFSGKVIKQNIEVGQWVKVDDSVIKLASFDKVKLRAFVPQRYYQEINLNAKARIVFDAFQSFTHYAAPKTLIAYANQQSRSFPLILELNNQEKKIAPGMSAKVYLELLGPEVNMPVIPRDAVIVKADNQRIVWKVITQKNKTIVSPVNISIGRQIDEWVEVSGNSLSAGDKIVLLGNERLRPGQEVQLSEE
ncbi:MAG: efflux RND transporter periplasmic adaptor subunit [Gammaproteobacteria bacterium]|nr:efflux RND transporter periplasmic adaptor subunit [Gammaproteobacteria bacterium]